MEANLSYLPSDDHTTRAFKYIVRYMTELDLTRRQVANAAALHPRTLNNLLNGRGYMREEQLSKLLRGVIREYGHKLPQNKDGYLLILQDMSAEVYGIAMSGWK